ncbi:hypothetical protein ABK040_006799 [Willaertia magna]
MQRFGYFIVFLSTFLFLFSWNANASGVVAADAISLNGNIQLTIKNQDQLNALKEIQTNNLISLSIYCVELEVFSNTPRIPSMSEFFTTITNQKPAVQLIKTISLPQQQNISFPINYNLQYQINNIDYPNLKLNNYYIIFSQINNNEKSRTTFNGWYRKGYLEGFLPIQFTQNINQNSFNLLVEGVTPFPLEEKRFKDNGVLRKIKGYTVLSLYGNETERSYAHGYLLSSQIIDFLKYYLLEGDGSNNLIYNYLNVILPVLQNSFYFDKTFTSEVNAMYQGMIDSGVDLYLIELNRKFLPIDIIAINAYIEIEFIQRYGVPQLENQKLFNYLKSRFNGNANKKLKACSQFAIWSSFTTKHCDSQQYGNLISGRNMDGEIDYKRATVHLFLISSIHSSIASDKRYISVMWPGFIGTLSGVNEDGVYTMMNYGISSNLSPKWSESVITTWIVKNILQKTSLSQATPNNVLSLINKYNSGAGGACVTGCVLFITRRTSINDTMNTPPAFVFEGDYTNGMMRSPGYSFPWFINNAIGATNHFQLYGVDPSDKYATKNFGRTNDFSSMWRYTVGINPIAVWDRIEKQEFNCFDKIKESLQRAAHGSTEHSVIFRPQNNKSIKLDIAVAANTFTAWDAPYLNWITYDFEELFHH